MKSNQTYLSYILVGAAALFAGNVRAGLLYEPDSYVSQDNIVVNLDGIRNAGLLKAHDNNAEEWKNIGRAANDATFTFKEGDTSGWVADGFHFARRCPRQAEGHSESWQFHDRPGRCRRERERVRN